MSFYPRLSQALKGDDAVLSTIFHALGLAVRIWPVSEGRFSKENTDAAPRFRDLITTEEETEGDLKASKVSDYQDPHQNLNLADRDTIEIKG